MNAAFIDHLISVAIGLVLILSRRRMVEKIADPRKKQKTDRVLKVCGPIVLGSGILLALGSLGKPAVDLDRVVREVGARLPLQIDEVTRIDRLSAGPGQQLTYHMTLLSLKADEVDRDEWKQNTMPALRANMRQAEGAKPFLAAGVTLIARYSGKDGALIDEIVLRPEDPPSK